MRPDDDPALSEERVRTGAQFLDPALDEPPFLLEERTEPPEILTGPRIGLTRATERTWRYGLAGSRFLSRSLGRASP